MSNVIAFRGAMRPPKKLTEADLDAMILQNRERYEAAFETAPLQTRVPVGRWARLVQIVTGRQ